MHSFGRWYHCRRFPVIFVGYLMLSGCNYDLGRFDRATTIRRHTTQYRHVHYSSSQTKLKPPAWNSEGFLIVHYYALVHIGLGHHGLMSDVSPSGRLSLLCLNLSRERKGIGSWKLTERKPHDRVDLWPLPYLTLPYGEGVLPPSAEAYGGPDAHDLW